MSAAAELFTQWLGINGIILRPWQVQLAQDYWSQPAAAGKSFLLRLLTEFENGEEFSAASALLPLVITAKYPDLHERCKCGHTVEQHERTGPPWIAQCNADCEPKCECLMWERREVAAK